MQILSISFREFLQKEKDKTLYFFAYKSIQTSIIYFHQVFCCNQKFLGMWLSLIFGPDSVGIKKKKSEKRASLILVQKEEVEPLIRLEDCCDCLCSPSAVRHAFMPSCYIISVLF